MAKLSIREIRALAAKIKKELNEAINEQNKKNREEAEKKFFTTAIGKKVRAVREFDKRLISTSELSKHLDYKHNNTYGSWGECPIESELIIAQIDSKDDIMSKVDEITKRLKAKIK
jgi:hypothetical protein